MAVHSRASIRYARALIMAADEAGQSEQLLGETTGLRGLLTESPELVSFLDDPTVDVDDKHSALEQIFGGKLSPLMWHFLELLLQKRREPLLADILDVTVALIDERDGRVTAEVRSAQPLADDQQVKLRDQLAELTGKQVTVSVETDPSLTAGFIARVGDTVYDASLSAQLARLRRRLMSADIAAAARDNES